MQVTGVVLSNKDGHFISVHYSLQAKEQRIAGKYAPSKGLIAQGVLPLIDRLLFLIKYAGCFFMESRKMFVIQSSFETSLLSA